MRRHSSLAIVSIVFLAACGCSRGDRSELAPVSGTVTFDGQPLSQGTIVFETPGSRPATGLIENGQIVEVSTYQFNDGAPVGKHKVAIQSVATAGAGGSEASPADFSQDPTAYMATASLIPTKYGSPTDSGLTAEIKAGDENRLEFNLEKE
jgi:hypothetical protein